MENKIITLRSVYKVKEYHVQPTKQPNGLNWPWVKPVRVGADGRSEMVLTPQEQDDPNRAYFIPEDMDIQLTDGTTFNLMDPLQYNIWMSIKDCSIIAPSRDARDNNGNLIIDGDKKRYGIAELYIDVAGEESERSVTRKKLITKAWTLIENDSINGVLTKCKLLGRNMKNSPMPDAIDFLYREAERMPNRIIDLYENKDTALKLLHIDAIEKGLITKKNGMFVFGDVVLGSNEDSVLLFLKLPTSKNILDQLTIETYPDIAKTIYEKKPEPVTGVELPDPSTVVIGKKKSTKA